jgi:hypothetical protein
MIHATAVVALRAINSLVWLMRARTSFELWCHAQAPKTAVDRPKAKLATMKKLMDWKTFPKNVS